MRYSARDPYISLSLLPLTFVKNRDLPFASFDLDKPLHFLDSLSGVFLSLPASSPLALDCQGEFLDPCATGMPSPTDFQPVCILVLLVSSLLVRSCSSLAFQFVVDQLPLLHSSKNQ